MRVRGFTLTELMITLVVIATLGAFATPALSRLQANIRMTSTTSEVASALQLARLKAITQNASMRVLFDTTAHTYQFQQRDPLDHTLWRAVDTVKHLPSEVTIAEITGNPVIFQSGRGSTVPGSNTTITLQTRHGKKADIVVAQTGRVTVKKYD